MGTKAMNSCLPVARGTRSPRWRWCERAGLLSLVVSCCSPLLEPALDVLSVTESDGDIRIDHQRHGLPRGTLLLAADDFDGDGADELLIADSGLSMIRGDGRRRHIWSGERTIAAALAAATSQHGARLLILIKPPEGPTSLVQLSCSFAGEASCHEEGRVDIDPGKTAVARANGLAIGDLDEDGVMDVLARGEDRILLFLGRMRGDDVVEWTSYQPYGEVSAHISAEPEYGLRRIAVADIDGDDQLDVVTVDHGAGLRVFFGDGLGSWDESMLLPEHDRRFFRQLYVVSSVGDPLVEIVGDDWDGTPIVFESSGARTFEMSMPVTSDDPPGGLRVFVGSFQSDVDELLVLDYLEGTAYLASPTQDAWDVREITMAIDYYRVHEGVVADLDGDGRDEVALVSEHEQGDGC
jgi:hypothetical protein